MKEPRIQSWLVRALRMTVCRCIYVWCRWRHYWKDSVVHSDSQSQLRSSSFRSGKICQRSWASAWSLFLPCFFTDLPNWHHHHITWCGCIWITEGWKIHYSMALQNLWVTSTTQTLQPKHRHCGRKPSTHCNSFLSLLSVAYRLKRRMRHLVREA